MKTRLFHLILFTTLCLPWQTQGQFKDLFDLALGQTDVAPAQKVKDPEARKHLKASLVKATEQIRQLKKQTDFLEDAKNKVQKVSNKVKEFKGYKRIIERNGRVVNLVKSNIAGIVDSPDMTPQEISIIQNSYQSILNQAIDNLEFVSNIISDDYWEMTDFERITLLQKKEKEMKSLEYDAELKIGYYKRRVEHRRFVRAVNRLAEERQRKLDEYYKN